MGSLNCIRRDHYYKILVEGDRKDCHCLCCHKFSSCLVQVVRVICFLPSIVKETMHGKFHEHANHHAIWLTEHEEQAFIETLVNSEHNNIWSVLMPAVYMLVPGSMIAKLWFGTILTPDSDDNFFANLMVISGSL